MSEQTKTNQREKTNENTITDERTKADELTKTYERVKADSHVRVDERVKADAHAKIDEPTKIDERVKADAHARADEPIKMSEQKNKKTLKPEQEQAICLPQDLLVSANAGSGKTFVMLRRVVHYIVDEKANILDFLLITFTDAAASQIRVKLEKELLKRYNDESITLSQKEHLRQQISLLPQADISTIHTFCYKLIKKYFYILNIDASCTIADEDASGVLQEKAMQNTLNHFTQGQQADFMELLSAYDNKRNFNTIKDIVFQIHNFLQNQPNKDIFKEQIKKVYTTDLDQSNICTILNDYVVSTLAYYKKIFENIEIEARQIKYAKLESACYEIVQKISQVSAENGFNKNHEVIFNYIADFPDKPRATGDPEQDALSAYMGNQKKDLTDELKRIREKIYLSKNIQELQQDLFWCKDNVDMLIQVEEKFSENYQQLKIQHNVIDFSDLEHLALKLLENQTVNEEVSKLYKQIFVDEYQDVNDIQEVIITRVWKEGQNTLFLVGDPKQSIYRFRNTNPKIMLDKVIRFTDENSGKKAINLKHNFRSDINILSFVDWVFSKIMTPTVAKIDYKQSSMFQAGIDFPVQENNLPIVEMNVVAIDDIKKEKIIPEKVYSVKDAENKQQDEMLYAKSEAYIIASKIVDLINGKHKIFDTDKNILRDIEYDDIAILYRARGDYINTIVSELEKCDIPVRNVSKEKVLDEYEVQVLYKYLQLLINTQDDYALTGFLSSPIINCSFDELSNLREKGEGAFYSLCKEYQSEYPKIARAYSLIEQGRQKLINGTIYEVLRWLIKTTNYESLVLSMANGQGRLTNVQVYLNDFLSRGYNSDLVSYLSYVDNNDEIKNSTQSSGEHSAISVVTMHQSKGLEYPIVFAVDMGHQFNKRSLTGPCLFSPELGIGVQVFNKEDRYKKGTVARSAIIIQENEQEFAEQLRVLYVGLTRAKNHLYIIGKAKIDDKLENNTESYILQKQNNYMSILLSCLQDVDVQALKMGKEHLTIKSGDKATFELNIYSPILCPDDAVKVDKNVSIDLHKVGYSDEIVQKLVKNCDRLSQQSKKGNIAFKNSVTRLMQENEYQTQYAPQPQTFNFKESVAGADEIGTAYHKAMEIIPLQLTSQQEIAQYLKENLDLDTLKLIDCEKIFKCVNYLQRWTTNAEKIIREGKFYLYIPYNSLIGQSDITNRVLIQGVVDFVACCGDETILIDFKTTREKDDEKMRQKYKIQMECYKIAVENALKRKVTSKILYSFFKDCEILFDN